MTSIDVLRVSTPECHPQGIFQVEGILIYIKLIMLTYLQDEISVNHKDLARCFYTQYTHTI
jgi:hypothetical protein